MLHCLRSHTITGHVLSDRLSEHRVIRWWSCAGADQSEMPASRNQLLGCAKLAVDNVDHILANTRKHSVSEGANHEWLQQVELAKALRVHLQQLQVRLCVLHRQKRVADKAIALTLCGCGTAATAARSMCPGRTSTRAPRKSCVDGCVGQAACRSNRRGSGCTP